MPTSPSPNEPLKFAEYHTLRMARAAVLNGAPIPAQIQAQLEARGIDVGALEQRLLQSTAFSR